VDDGHTLQSKGLFYLVAVVSEMLSTPPAGEWNPLPTPQFMTQRGEYNTRLINAQGKTIVGDTERGRLCCCFYRQESRKPKKKEQQLCNALHNTTPPTSFSQPPGVKVQMKPCLRPSSSSSSSFLLVVVVLLRFVSPSPTISLSPFHSWRKPNQKNKK
jgi:hypothetical protein